MARLLSELQSQLTDGLFTYSVIVVDNDYAQSAKTYVEAFKKKCIYNIDYYNEPEQNIALARNKAVDNAKGNFIAFIDDDEFPVPHWLLNLYKAYREFKADGILGPVKPHFDEKPPDWLVKGKFCERKSHKTGTVLQSKNTRTGNVLLSSTIFEDKDIRFGAEFGRTGGEDINFFNKMIGEGRIFVWCDEAPVYETVPPERWEKSFYLKNNLRIGGLTGEHFRNLCTGGFDYLAKVTAAFCLYTLLLPFSFIFGQHSYMKCLTKVFYYFGCISGFLGYVPIRFREK